MSTPPPQWNQPGNGQPGPWPPGPPQPGQPPHAAGPDAVLVTIGDIACTSTEVITPSGRCPVGTATWTFTDMSRTTKSIPTWAIVCTVIFFVFCLLGLLFLLVKEERTEGSVQVVVQGPGLLHQIQLPVSSVAQIQDYAARVAYARNVTAGAANRNS
jgi:hypothetical protein